MENKSHSTTDGKRKLVQNSRKKEEDGPKKLPLKLLEEITNSFAEEQRLGSGAFGDVYKGVLDGELIAVKKLRFMLGISDKQFENEFGHLSKLKHQNIVQLVGFCDETKEELVLHEGRMVIAEKIYKALCLEFVPNGCLGKFLSEQSPVNNWHIHFKIIKGICEGLNYLHRFSILHLDLKPGNILLDEKMVPKIADFGLSRLMLGANTKITMSQLGTCGYMPPEFINHQIISTKYDIFSLGVILKRIVGGGMDYNSIADMGKSECIKHVHDYWEKKLQEMPRYASLEVDCNQVRSCIEIAVDCMEQDRQKRPTIEDIVRKLDKLKRRTNGDIVRKLNKLEVKRSQIEQCASDWPRKLPLKLLEEITNSSRKLPLKILEQITNSFAKEQRLGSGEFGAVYKAVLDGEVIAVKMLHFMPGVTDKQFENEFEYLSKLKHQNIVQLVGFCDEAKEVLLPYQGQIITDVETQRALCLEFVPHGCLGKFLSEQCLVHDWHVRFNQNNQGDL